MKNNSDKLLDAIDGLIRSKDHCDALNAKNERLHLAYTKDIRKLCALPSPPLDKIKRLLVQRKMIHKSLEVTNRHILSIFQHQLTLEQARLNLRIGESLTVTHGALRHVDDQFNSVSELRDALDDMAHSVCEVSGVLATHDHVDMDDSESDLESELAALIASPTRRIAADVRSSIPTVPSTPISERGDGDDGSDGYRERMKS